MRYRSEVIGSLLRPAYLKEARNELTGGRLSPDEIKERGLFPYRSLPHPLHANGGQVFPQVQTAMFPRLERFDVEFDIPNEFLPEFPPAIFLQNRPELGDTSRGQVLHLGVEGDEAIAAGDGCAR